MKMEMKLIQDEILTPCYNNTYYVCYDAWNNTVFDDLVALKDDSIFTKEAKETFDEEIQSLAKEDTELYGLLYDYVTGIAFDKYYEKDVVKGQILASFSQDYIDQIFTAFNNART